MHFLRKLTAEPALLLGVVTLGLGLLVLFGVDLTNEQTGSIVAFLGALMALVRYLVTPNRKVVARVSESRHAVVAGDAAAIPTGTPLTTYAAPGDGDVVELADRIPLAPAAAERVA